MHRYGSGHAALRSPGGTGHSRATMGRVPDERATSQTLDRGLTLLKVLAEAEEPMVLNQLGDALGLHRSIVYRLVRTLIDHNLVVHTPFGYVLGTGAHSLGRRSFPVLQRIARPEVARLAAAVGLTAFFVVRDREEAVTLVSVEVESARTRSVYSPRDRHPLTLGAPGLAILSADPPRPGERQEITQARGLGFASTRGEVIPDMATIAAPVLTASGEAVAAVAIAHSTELLGHRETKAVLDTARIISGHVRRAQGSGAVFPGIA